MQTAYVYIHLDGEFVPAGVMQTYEEIRSGYSIFQYGKKYLKRRDAVEIDPILLPLSEIEYRTPEWLKLFGGIRDAAPDSWGRYVLEREAGKSLSEFDYLVAASSDRVGALGFGDDPVNGPRRMGLASKASLDLDLDNLVFAAQSYMDKEKEIHDSLKPFIEYGASFGGARPKALAKYKERYWVAKFEAKEDLRSETKIEYANMLLAKRCGITIPDIKHVTVKSGHHVLLVERFDREKSNGKIYRKHFVSGLSMLNENENYVIEIDPEKHSYGTLADIIRRYGAPGSISDDMEELFRRMIFNIICSNGDDHLRNHGFLYDSYNKGWRLSPCYDIVPDVNPYGMLGLGVGPLGRQASIKNAVRGCSSFGLNKDEANHIIRRVCEGAKAWQTLFADCQVTDTEIKKLEKNFHFFIP